MQIIKLFFIIITGAALLGGCSIGGSASGSENISIGSSAESANIYLYKCPDPTFTICKYESALDPPRSFCYERCEDESEWILCKVNKNRIQTLKYGECKGDICYTICEPVR